MSKKIFGSKAIPILFFFVLTLLHILAPLLQMLTPSLMPSAFSLVPQTFSLLSFLYACVYIGIWTFFLWYSVKTGSKRLLIFYQVFWITLVALHLFLFLLAILAILIFALLFRIDSPILAFLISAPMLLTAFLRAPLEGFGHIAPTDSVFFSVIFLFVISLLMSFLGILARRKLVESRHNLTGNEGTLK